MAICPDGNCEDGELPVRLFALGSYNSTRQKASGHVDVDGVNLMAGVSLGNDSCETPLTLALFAEWGEGDYTSRGNVSGNGRLKGKGDLEYYGGGILARTDKVAGDLYLEGSFRLGRYNSEYKSGDFYVPSYLGGRLPKVEVDGMYYGAHAGLGYVFALGDSAKLDTSVKYLWTRLEGDNVTVLGDRFKFDDVDSHRVQAGGRVLWEMENKLFAPYLGARYEYEFDGKAGGTVQGFRIPKTDMKGSTGLFDAGVKMRLRQDTVTLDFGVTGTVGQREGIGGHALLSWNF